MSSWSIHQFSSAAEALTPYWTPSRPPISCGDATRRPSDSSLPPSSDGRFQTRGHQAITVHGQPFTELLTLAAPTTHNDHYFDHCSGNNDSSGDSGSPMGVSTDKKRDKLHEQQHK